MGIRDRLYISAVTPLVLWACASSPDLASNGNGQSEVVYAAVGPEAVDALRASATELDAVPNGPGADEVVCRREEKTGSHVRRVVCRTERERASMRQNSQEWLRSGGQEGGPVVAR
jgi:hypothetical protein